MRVLLISSVVLFLGVLLLANHAEGRRGKHRHSDHVKHHSHKRHGSHRHPIEDGRGVLSDLIYTPIKAAKKLINMDPLGAVKEVYDGVTGAGSQAYTKFGEFASVIQTAVRNLAAGEINDFWRASEKPIKYMLFTQKNKATPHVLTKDGTVEGTFWNTKVDTKIIIHGFTPEFLFKNSTALEGELAIKDSYIESGHDYNIIVADWTSLTSTIDYIGAAASSIVSGADISNFILLLFKKRNIYSLDNVHIIGTSLGAHAAGIAGQLIYKTTEQKVGRITGVDPSGGLFDVVNELTPTDAKNYLDRSDAQFVDIMHCNYGRKGFLFPGKKGSVGSSGHADFFPNGGTDQPGCSKRESLQGCDSNRCWHFFANSIIEPHKYPACKCETWDDYQAGKCDKECEGHQIYMGDSCPKSARGEFYLEAKANWESVPEAIKAAKKKARHAKKGRRFRY